MDILKHYGDVLLQMIGIFSSLWLGTYLVSLGWHKGKAKYPVVTNGTTTVNINSARSKSGEDK